MELMVGMSCRFPRQEVAGAQPDELGFVGIQSKPIWRHPGFHGVDDVYGSGSQNSIVWGCMLCVDIFFRDYRWAVLYHKY